jgi:hypothetical protein
MAYPKHYIILALLLSLSSQYLATAATQEELVVTLTDNEIMAISNIAEFAHKKHITIPDGLKNLWALLLNGQREISSDIIAESLVEAQTLLTDNELSIAEKLNAPLADLEHRMFKTSKVPDIIVLSGSPYIYGPTHNNLVIGNENAGESLTCHTTDNTAVGADSLINTTSGYQNTAFGSQSLYNNDEGYNNTGIGFQALYHNTGGTENAAIGNTALFSNITGDHNTAIGSNALYSNTRGNNNTALGHNAGYNTTEGCSNIAIGSSALHCNRLGSDNIALGIHALKANVASHNTAVGAHTMEENTVGVGNVAVGRQSLMSNTYGCNNTAVGTETLLLNTTGQGNTAVGVIALSSNTCGKQNTAVGLSALSNNTSSDNNTALGFQSLIKSTGEANVAVGAGSLWSHSCGDGNVAIGTGAGSELIHGSNNIFIGADAGEAISCGSNTVYLGNRSNQYFYIPGIAQNSGYEHGIDDNTAYLTISQTSGQLGLDGESSARYKDDVRDMGLESKKLQDLRPVTFVYKNQHDKTRLQYGLIAEEVAEIFPTLVGYKNGIPERVHYQKLPALLLNEYQQQEKRLRMTEEKIDSLDGIVDRLNKIEKILNIQN